MHINYRKLLQGYYEARYLPKDFSPDRIVPDFGFNVLNKLGLLYKPVIDEHYIKSGGLKPNWPDKKPFVACLTHDVDFVTNYSLKQSLKKRQLQFLENYSIKKITKGIMGYCIDLARVVKQIGEKDPLHYFEIWLKVEKEVNARSTFFFWPGLDAVKKRHNTDCVYELTDKVVFDSQKCSVAEMIKEIDQRGWEIGLHSSWYSFNNVDEIKYQKEALEKVLGEDIVSVRQHYLHYDIRITPSVHTKAGFIYDSTLGFNDNVGFRFGTCYPWHIYDLRTNNNLPLIEIPPIIQDGALLNSNKGLRLDYETSFHYIKRITAEVEKVGGVLTLLWHPQYIIKPEYWNLYLRTLKYLKQKNAWFASVREVGKWWKEKLKMSERDK